MSSIGDMGAHIIDQPFWALGLDYPTSIIASSTPWGGGEKDPGTYPFAMTAAYEFAARGNQPPVRLIWYDGGLLPVLSAGHPAPARRWRRRVRRREGLPHLRDVRQQPEGLPRVARGRGGEGAEDVRARDESHETNWADACKGEGTASSQFDYAAKLTETMLLGIVALRAGQSKKILYDGAKMQVTNVPEANRWLTREYRSGLAAVERVRRRFPSWAGDPAVVTNADGARRALSGALCGRRSGGARGRRRGDCRERHRERRGRRIGRSADFVEPGFPFFVSTLDAGKLGAAFPSGTSPCAASC